MTIDLGTLGALGVGIALAVGTMVVVGSRSGPVRRAWDGYVAFLRHHLELLFIHTPPERVAALHVGGVGAMVAAAAALKSLVIVLFVPFAAVLVPAVLSSRRGVRVARIESQLEVWLRAVANSLKAAPSIGDALASSAALVPAPISQEVDLVLKEMALGVPLDRALEQAAERIQSPSFSSVVTTLLIARKSGGNLPVVLEKAAGTLREMERLQGVVRTRTAEGKAQAYVLGALPFAIAGFLQWTDDQYFVEFASTNLGVVLLIGAAALWMGSIAASLKILKVDI